jgi:hypothetical protein
MGNDHGQTEESSRGITVYLKRQKHLFSIAMSTMVFGGTYQVLNAIWWGWWIKEAYNYREGFNLQQEFAWRLGFLAAPLFVLNLSSLIIGIILLRYADTGE